MSEKHNHKREQKRPVVSGFILLGLGLFLLFLTTDMLPPIEHSWPVLIIIAGLALILGTVFKSRKHDRNQFDGNLSR